MELRTIDMDRAEARAKYIEYRDAVRERHDAELAEIMRGYRALAQGHQVIDLVATIRAGGTVVKVTRGAEHTLPALAVMRADQPWCWVEARPGGSCTFAHDRWPASNAKRNVVRFPEGTFGRLGHQQRFGNEDRLYNYASQAKAMVPPVPPGLRPRHGLGNYHVLWEAEWEQAAPVDPALLKHIGGDLYAVLATWDLTELERTVLARRFH